MREKYISVLMVCLMVSPVLFSQTDTLPDSGKNPVSGMFFYRYMGLRRSLFDIRYRMGRDIADTSVSPLYKPGWELTFFDDFDSFDNRKWRKGQAWGEYIPGNHHQYFAKNAIETKNGCLYLNTIKQPVTFKTADSSITMTYGVGLINSDMSFMQKYGYFEIRSKNPSGPATWPAFWLTGAHRWPPEIDIFEMYGGKTGKGVHRQHTTVHWGISGTKSRGYLTKSQKLPENTDTAFHIYACEWSPEYISFYTDGKLIRKQYINKKLRRWLDDEMVVVLNNGLEEKYIEHLPADFISNSFVIDWVRVYRKKD